MIASIDFLEYLRLKTERDVYRQALEEIASEGLKAHTSTHQKLWTSDDMMEHAEAILAEGRALSAKP